LEVDRVTVMTLVRFVTFSCGSQIALRDLAVRQVRIPALSWLDPSQLHVSDELSLSDGLP
jgi:hypothetical protein